MNIFSVNKIRHEGKLAYAHGKSLDDNPYLKDSKEAWNWRVGFLQAADLEVKFKIDQANNK